MSQQENETFQQLTEKICKLTKKNCIWKWEVRNNNTVMIDEEGIPMTYNIRNVKPVVPPDPGGLANKFVCQN